MIIEMFRDVSVHRVCEMLNTVLKCKRLDGNIEMLVLYCCT